MEMEGDEWRDGGWWTKMPWATTTINKRESRESVWVCAWERQWDDELTTSNDEWRATTSDERRRVPSDDEWRATIWANKTTINQSVRRDKKYDSESERLTKTEIRTHKQCYGTYLCSASHWLLSCCSEVFLWPSCDARGAWHFFWKVFGPRMQTRDYCYTYVRY
jgi:hypothetical protein